MKNDYFKDSFWLWCKTNKKIKNAEDAIHQQVHAPTHAPTIKAADNWNREFNTLTIEFKI